MRRRTTLNKIICIILMLVLIIELLLAFSILLLKNTVLSKSYIEKKLEKADYYRTTKVEIEDAFKYYVLQSNLDDECVTDLITVKRVKDDTNLILKQCFDDEKEEVEVQDIKEELTKRIKEKLVNEYNHIMTESEKKDIETIVNIIVEKYSDNMKTLKSCIQAISDISKKADKIKDTYVIGLVIIIIATIAALSGLYIMGSKNKKMIFNKYHAIALMTVGFMVIITMTILEITLNISQIQLFTKGITNLVVEIVKSIRIIVWIFGIITFMMGLFIAIAKNILMRKYLR